MENTNHRYGWVIFSLFVWLHLAQSLYPLPSQRAGDIETYAIEAVENSNELAEKGFERDEYMQWSKEEWETELTASYWSIWFIDFIFLMFGLISTFFLYKNMRMWPVFLGSSSIICFIYILIPYLDLESPFTEWMKIMKHTLENSHYLVAYFTGMWPMYLLILFIFSIWVPLTNGRKHPA